MSFSALNQYDFYEYTCTLHLDVLTNDINLQLLKLYKEQTVHQFHPYLSEQLSLHSSEYILPTSLRKYSTFYLDAQILQLLDTFGS